MDSFHTGEVWIVDLGLAAKVRPCLIISVPALDQDRALVTVIPHTTSSRGSRFEVRVTVSFLRTGVFDAQNVVTIPQAKLLRKLGVLSTVQLSFVEDAVRSWLGLQPRPLEGVSYPERQ
jgi:mRNA interferase MazF